MFIGSPNKDNVLLYEVKNGHILQIWGTVDSDHLANNSDLTAKQLQESKIWLGFTTHYH